MAEDEGYGAKIKRMLNKGRPFDIQAEGGKKIKNPSKKVRDFNEGLGFKIDKAPKREAPPKPKPKPKPKAESKPVAKPKPKPKRMTAAQELKKKGRLKLPYE